MGLKAPGIITFVVSIILVVCAVVVRFFGAEIPMIAGHEFMTVLVAYLILVMGCLLRAL